MSRKNGVRAVEPYWIGVDLGGTSVKGVALRPEGHVLESVHVTFVDRDRAWAEAVRGIVLDFSEKLGRPAAVGLSAPGLVSRDGRSIAFMPGRLEGLEGFDWGKYLDLGLEVPVLNDAHAALLGEVWRGAAKGLRDVFLLTLGTGVGGAAMVDGHLLRGHLGRAGHLGHVTVDLNGPPDCVGAPGSIEWEMGNFNISERSLGRFATTQALVDAYRKKDPDAVRLWSRSVRSLAIGIGSLINVLDPEAVIVGGGVASAGPALLQPLQAELAKVEWRPGGSAVRLALAQLGKLAGAYGSAAHAGCGLGR